MLAEHIGSRTALKKDLRRILPIYTLDAVFPEAGGPREGRAPHPALPRRWGQERCQMPFRVATLGDEGIFGRSVGAALEMHVNVGYIARCKDVFVP